MKFSNDLTELRLILVKRPRRHTNHFLTRGNKLQSASAKTPKPANLSLHEFATWKPERLGNGVQLPGQRYLPQINTVGHRIDFMTNYLCCYRLLYVCLFK